MTQHHAVDMGGMDNLFHGFLDTFGEGSTLVLTPLGQETPFVQFAKRVESGNIVLLFGFPDAPWSRKHFERVMNALDDETTRIVTTGEKPVTRFLELAIDASDPAVAATKGVSIVRRTFESMDVPGDSRFSVELAGPMDISRFRKELQRIMHSDRANFFQKAIAKVLFSLSLLAERIVNRGANFDKYLQEHDRDSHRRN